MYAKIRPELVMKNKMTIIIKMVILLKNKPRTFNFDWVGGGGSCCGGAGGVGD